jgi:hypothetical protein
MFKQGKLGIVKSLFCLHALGSTEIRSFLQLMGSGLRSMEMRIPMLGIPSPVDGFLDSFQMCS